MSTPSHADDRRTADAPASPEPAEGAGMYLTDEVFLYRVVGSVAGGENGMIELEDCYGLDVVRVPVKGVRARRLREVIPPPIER